jgi:hypothetical protein
MKMLHTFFVLLLIPLMILSTGGFNIFKHMCHDTGVTMVSFQSPESCEHESGEHHEDCLAACCNHMETTHSCCENNHLFIRTIDNISNTDDRPVIDADNTLSNITATILFIALNQKIPEEYLFTDYASPPEHSGKSTVVKLHSLKIDCCSVV